MFGKITFEKFLRTLENIKHGSLEIISPEGNSYLFEGSPEPKARMRINDYDAIVAIAAKGDIGLAESYRDGKWDCDDLSALIHIALKNDRSLNRYLSGNWLNKITARFLNLLNSNTLKGSRRNIHAHYDLGNEFYSLWLDPSMTYSSAIFNNENESLTEAQNNKYDRILNLLGHKSGNILEIGCGWGGFAERAITRNDSSVKGLTLSDEQHLFARERLKNLSSNANIAIQDYRHEKGKYDNIVSIEMFEAVGERYWPMYFQKISSLLKQKGKAVIQTITIGDEYFENYRKCGDFIRAYIFPGGMLPSSAKFDEEAKKAGLKVTDKFYFGKDYVITLERWLHSFDSQIKSIKELGFDERFIRIWRLYLAGCIAGFSVGRTDVMQVELQHV